jgi:hypothetical protein
MSTITTWLDGYLELRHRAFTARGAIELDDGTRWPRTTGEQVAAIAAAFTPAIRTNAAPRVVTRWRGVLADIQHDALADLHDTYIGNRTFWATLEAVAVYLDNLALRPPAMRAWSALFAIIDAGDDGPRNAGPSGDGPFKHFDGIQTFDDLYNAEFKYLRELRGDDKMQPDPGMSGVERTIPRTTNADVIALGDYWTRQLSAVKDIMGTDAVTKTWRAAMADVDQLARRAEPTAVYTKNNAFWRALSQTAIHVAVADEAPSKWDLAKDAIKDSIVHLPDTISTVASKGVDVIADTAHAAGKVVNEAGKGLLSGAGTPLLIGAGVLGALLLFRGTRKHEEA